MTIYRNKIEDYKKVDHPVFQHIEKEVKSYIQSDTELQEMYYSDDAIYSVKRSVRAVLDEIDSNMERRGATKGNLYDYLNENFDTVMC